MGCCRCGRAVCNRMACGRSCPSDWAAVWNRISGLHSMAGGGRYCYFNVEKRWAAWILDEVRRMITVAAPTLNSGTEVL